MKLRHTLSIRQRHTLILVIVALGFLITGGLSHYSSSRLGDLHELAIQLETLEQRMLTLRRHEKDFLSRKGEKYITNFNEEGQQTLALSADFGQALEAQGIVQSSTLDFSEVEAELETYTRTFMELASVQQEIGLDHKSGLYGGLRNSIHQVEEVIDGQPLLLANMLMLRRHEKDFMLRRLDKYIDKFDKSMGEFKGNLPDALRPSVLPKLENYQAQFLTLFEAEQRLGLSHKEGLHGELRDSAHRLETQFGEVKTLLKEQIHSQTEMISWFLYATLASLAVVTVLFVVLLSKSISNALARLIQYVLGMMNDEALNHRVKSKNNELEILEEAFNALNQKLSNAISEIKTSAGSITDVASEMAVMTEQVNQSTEEQHYKVEQSATAMEEMSKAIQEVANNAQSTANFVGNVNEKLNETTQISGLAQDAIRTLQGEVKKSVGAIAQLEESSGDIEALLDSIQDIADQTNMLALNAAIEAARAGDHGRGFAVVADEVRTLSARTTSATDEVRTTLNQFKQVIADVVESVESSSEKGEQGQHQADHAIKMMREMTQKVAEISMMNIQIATSVEEQTAASNELNAYIHDIFESSKCLKEHSQQTSLATEKLSEVVKDINQSASAFAV